MTVKDWIIKEQGRHFCQCGCGTEILINRVHHSRGIPKYIRGHRMRVEKRGLYGWVKEQQGNHFCQCGCSEEIIITRIHHSKGIPKFINGHSWAGRKHSKESKDKQRESKTGENNARFGTKHSKESIEKMSGVNSHNWLGGISFKPYCNKFNNRLKERIRDRYNRTCQLCGLKENGEKLSIHHIHYDKENCDPDLISLCRSCNSKVNVNREYYESLFMNMIK